MAREFAPQLILISAGYDAHREDPLADCMVTDGGYAAMTRSMRSAAAELEAPLGAVLEGGYALGALARSVAVTMEGLSAAPVTDCRPVRRSRRSPAGALERLAEWWPALTRA